MWDGAAEALLGGLNSHMPQKGGCKTLSWPVMQSVPSSSSSSSLVSSSSSLSVENPLHHTLDITAVQTMLELNRQFLSMYTWTDEFQIASDDAEGDEGEEEVEEGEGEAEEQGEWLTEHELIGSRVCIMREEQGITY